MIAKVIIAALVIVLLLVVIGFVMYCAAMNEFIRELDTADRGDDLA